MSDSSVHLVTQYNGGTEHEMKFWLDRKYCGLKGSYRQQSGCNLGDKLKNAVRHSFKQGNEYVVVIGNTLQYFLCYSLQTGCI